MNLLQLKGILNKKYKGDSLTTLLENTELIYSITQTNNIKSSYCISFLSEYNFYMIISQSEYQNRQLYIFLVNCKKLHMNSRISKRIFHPVFTELPKIFLI